MEAAWQRHARLIEDARTWLPTGDAAAHGSIVAWLALAARTGVDPIAGLRAALSRWFGSAAGDLLQPQTVTALTTPSAPELVALETLSSLRRPTLWPQRPKRFADELFSSWLWRASVAAGAPPRRFAAEALAAAYADPDTEVSDATLHRLALLSGQPVSCLAAATLTVAHPVTRADAVLDALLRHGGFLLCAESRADRPRAVLQYCPRCLAADPLPYFRRGWRFCIQAVCVRHRCRLYDRCWRCNALVEPLGQMTASRQPLCAHCGALLAGARAAPAPDVVRRQRGLICVLYYAAVSLEPAAVHRHLDVLAGQFASDSPVMERAMAVGRLLPAELEHWFGPVADPRHRGLIQQHARGRAYNAWFGYAGTQQSSEHQDVPPPGRLPLSRRRRPQPSWFAARRPGRHRTRG